MTHGPNGWRPILARTANLAQLLEDAPLGVADEPAEIYKPIAFQPLSNKRELP